MDNKYDFKELTKKIEQFKKQTSLPKLQPPVTINEVLEDLSNLEMIRTLTVEELSEQSILLANYSLYLQSKENALKGFVHWCESNIKTIVGQQLKTSKEYGFQAKDAEIRSNDVMIQDLEKHKIEAEVKLNLIEKMSYKVQNLAEILKSVYIERMRYNKR